MRFATGIFILALTGTGCVNVQLNSHSTKHATGVVYAEPGSPFVKESRSDVDAAWKNNGNGNLLSYLSDCQDDSDPSLDTIVNSTTAGLNDLNIESRTSPTIQGREARRVIASGRVDGVPTKIDLLAFKRDFCIYILTYVGVEKSFAADHERFNRFVEGFKTP